MAVKQESSIACIEPHSAHQFSDTTYGGWRKYVYEIMAAEISRMSRYFDRVVQFRPSDADTGLLYRFVNNPVKQLAFGMSDLEDSSSESTLVLMNGTLNHELDIEGLLRDCHEQMSRSSRIAVVAYNSYLSWLYKLTSRLGLLKGEVPCTFLTESAIESLAKLAGFEIVRVRPTVFCPFHLFGLGDLINTLALAIPILKLFALAEIITLRPIKRFDHKPSLSIVIPARNEKGNIEDALKRLPSIADGNMEVIFVEGHSTDETWDEIQRVIPLYEHRFPIMAFKQSGKGKVDAVRLGFEKSTCEILTILDADLSMPPELLPRFYNAYVNGLGDFVNGNRLVYPIEGKAMKFLNKLGNIFFAKALSHVLGVPLGDSLCGTKLVSRKDYARMCAWRRDFGDFDPFGDFELLFPAATLGLGICEVPIRYRDRQYGETNISRFRHGFMLLKMTLIGFTRITLGALRHKPEQFNRNLEN
jgi:Glycosyltransferases involved in cell wall biogenesis